MQSQFSLSHFLTLFPNDDVCIEEIKKLRFFQGISCRKCRKVTKHYKVVGRHAYSCEYCRSQVYPLANTIFEKSTTPIRTWFFGMFLMAHTRGKISASTLQKELGVTYKTAWKMRKSIFKLMRQNHGDLLVEPQKTITVSFFNAFELKVIQKQEAS